MAINSYNSGSRDASDDSVTVGDVIRNAAEGVKDGVVEAAQFVAGSVNSLLHGHDDEEEEDLSDTLVSEVNSEDMYEGSRRSGMAHNAEAETKSEYFEGDGHIEKADDIESYLVNTPEDNGKSDEMAGSIAGYDRVRTIHERIYDIDAQVSDLDSQIADLQAQRDALDEERTDLRHELGVDTSFEDFIKHPDTEPHILPDSGFDIDGEIPDGIKNAGPHTLPDILPGTGKGNSFDFKPVESEEPEAETSDLKYYVYQADEQSLPEIYSSEQVDVMRKTVAARDATEDVSYFDNLAALESGSYGGDKGSEDKEYPRIRTLDAADVTFESDNFAVEGNEAYPGQGRISVTVKMADGEHSMTCENSMDVFDTSETDRVMTVTGKQQDSMNGILAAVDASEGHGTITDNLKALKKGSYAYAGQADHEDLSWLYRDPSEDEGMEMFGEAGLDDDLSLPGGRLTVPEGLPRPEGRFTHETAEENVKDRHGKVVELAEQLEDRVLDDSIESDNDLDFGV